MYREAKSASFTWISKVLLSFALFDVHLVHMESTRGPITRQMMTIIHLSILIPVQCIALLIIIMVIIYQ